HSARIEIPPRFIDGPKACPDTGEAVDECVAISYTNFQKRIVIKLADEGLTDEILDKFAPSIVVSELVANRRDCGSVYRVKSQLVKMFPIDVNVHDDKRDKAERQCCGEKRHTVKTFRQWDDEHWHKVEHVFSKYPQGMRYLVVECSGNDTQFWAGNYGPKMAKFRVNALFQSNSD
uniref:FBA domain-containing protein n=1 Tax=Globodera pallida TaxID=36090 RepID=A0A183CT80_GLOPA